MSVGRRAAAIVVVVLALNACLPATLRPSPTPSSSQPLSPTPSVDLCDLEAQVYSEGNSLGDAFRLVIADEIDGAIDAAEAIDQRLDAIVAALPDERTLTEPRSSLRGGVEAGAEVVR
jgi:hypothetical protein